MTRTINIHAVSVPNPNAMKFTIDGLLLTREAWQFSTPEEAKTSPIAGKLFNFPYVSQVYISQNFITINKTEDSPRWEEIMIDLRVMIKRHLELNQPLLAGEPIRVGHKEDLPASKAENQKLVKAMKALLDDQIKPATQQDGGEITFESFENGILKVKLNGACVGCPFGPRTLKNGVEVLVKRYFPEVDSVTSDDVDWSQTQQ